VDEYLRRRLIMLAIVTTIIVAILAIFGVFDIPHIFAIVAAVIVLDILRTQDRDWAPEDWPHAPIKFRRGARTEVARLAWATVGQDGNVSERVLERVRALARQILSDHGVTWSGLAGDPMQPTALAQELIGAAAVTTLTTKKGVKPRALERTVTRLEHCARTNNSENFTLGV